MAKKTEMNSRERRAAERAAQGVTAKEPKKLFVNIDQIRQAITPTIEEFGCILESLNAKGAGANKILEIMIDYTEERTDFLSLDTIAEVSQAVSQVLDDIDDGESPYLLEVSSPGANRTLTETRHWKRSLGRLLEIKPQDGSETFLARLDEVSDEGPVVRRKKNTKKGQKESYKEAETLPWNSISEAKVEIEFNH